MKFDFDKGNPVFEKFTDDICLNVYSKKKKAEIEEELTGHLAELCEQYTALGMSEEEASEKAVLQMGDRKEIQENFTKLYWVPPFLQIRTTLNLLIFGILFTHLHLGLFAGSQNIASALGTALVMLSIFRLKNNGGIFKPALYVYIVQIVFGCGVTFLNLYYGFDRIVMLSYVSALLLFISYLLVFIGLKRMCRNEGESTRIVSWGVAWTLLLGLVFALGQYEDSAVIAVFLGFLSTIIILFKLRRVKKILGSEDTSIVTLQTLSKTAKLKYTAAVLTLVLILPLASQYVAYTREPDYEEYKKTDTAYSEEVEAARRHVLELGLPKDILDDLPDSEVMNYKNAVSVQIKDEFTGENGVRATTYYFYCEDELDTLRALCCMNGFDGQKLYLRDGFYYQF